MYTAMVIVVVLVCVANACILHCVIASVHGRVVRSQLIVAQNHLLNFRGLIECLLVLQELMNAIIGTGYPPYDQPIPNRPVCIHRPGCPKHHKPGCPNDPCNYTKGQRPAIGGPPGRFGNGGGFPDSRSPPAPGGFAPGAFQNFGQFPGRPPLQRLGGRAPSQLSGVPSRRPSESFMTQRPA